MFRENISPKRFKVNISSLHELHNNRKRFYIPVIFYFHISVTLPTLQAFVDQQFSFVKRNHLNCFLWLFCDNSSLRFAWELCHLSQDKIIWIRCNSWWHHQWIFFSCLNFEYWQRYCCFMKVAPWIISPCLCRGNIKIYFLNRNFLRLFTTAKH